MYGPNPWGYPPQQPQYIYIPVPQQTAGPQVISTSEEARRLFKEMKKNERKMKKEFDDANKKKEGEKKPADKNRIDAYFATKWEVALFMCLIAMPIGVLEALLVRALIARLV